MEISDSMNNLMSLYLRLCIACLWLNVYALTDDMEASQSLRDGETLVSNGGKFELGFFSPGRSKDRYLGIWYKNIPVTTVVWVANRQNPIKDWSGLLVINNTSGLVLSNRSNAVVWSISSARMAQDPLLQLLDHGNLVVRDMRDENADNYLWQSFDYPSDTLLPGMKLGWDLRTRLNRRIISWKSSDDPGPGELSSGVELDAYPELTMNRGTRKFFRGGPWNGLGFSGAPELKKNPVFEFNFVSNKEEVYYVYRLLNTSVITRLVLNQTAMARQRYVWVETEMSWKLYSSVPRDYCDTYSLCGANGLCVISDSPVCQCLEGFKPKFDSSWNSMDWSQGCIREEPLDCARKHDFIRISGVKLPDTTHTWVNGSMNLRKCKETCLKNCSCMAYSNSDISGRGNGCVLWFGDLIDIRMFFDGGQDFYIRVPSSKQANRSRLVISVVVVPICVLLLLICYLLRGRMKGKDKNEGQVGPGAVAEREDLGLPLLDLATVARATRDFSVDNQLGEGGFGPVYKGVLMDGQNIAVKRLSKSSGQGLNEFKNEVKLIAKLQHRNLVRLLACCIEEDEKILIYEYMRNGSLDSSIYDQSRGSRLGWSQCFNIICGIARGLLYLHQDSRLRIIHRDLKASNVLLDDALNPKISDFGMARPFGGDQSQANTRRIVGTYGYMAPEYALYGLFSVKSDVFSFGILLLEIVSGKKNTTRLDNPHNHSNLIGYVWQMWREGRTLEVIGPLLDDALVKHEVMRCIHVGLLCIQQNPDDRPNIATVVLMLNGESMLPQPKEPAFLIDVIQTEACSSNASHSVNDITITMMEGLSLSFERYLPPQILSRYKEISESMNNLLTLYLRLCIACLWLNVYALTDGMKALQSLRDGETLVSNGGKFELGFFSPGRSKDRYLGIWYKNIPVRTVFWVANRQNPIKDSSGLLVINNTSGLVLSNRSNVVVWSASLARMAQDPLLQLLDLGNLVVRDTKDDSANNYLWQSFDYPSDTMMPGMKLGWDLRTRLNRRIIAWKSSDDPAPGEFSSGVELDAYPQLVMYKGTRVFYRGGPWNGLRFSGALAMKKNPVYEFKFVSNKEEVYYAFQLLNTSVITRLVVNETAMARQRYVWVETEMSWKLYSSVPRDHCDTYSLCGANGLCVISDSPPCQCLDGFKPKFGSSWNSMDWSQGCIREEPLDCARKHDFIRISGVKLPDTTHTWVNGSMNLRKCKETCLKNCSCMAYSNSDISGRGNGCVLWFGDLIDIRKLSDGGQDLHMRVPSSKQANRLRLVISVVVVPICVLLLLTCYLLRGRMKGKEKNEGQVGRGAVAEREDLGLPLLDLATVAQATGDFSVDNQLGEGGFGPVYKGVLMDGKDIAVKRLSKSSGQGLNEFKNEVKLIAKLQHRNLVRLLACCIEEDEKILIYEYMCNGSLDSSIFDQSRGPSLLDWSQRFNIICGIARGLLYLHQDSRLRIIHRDLKASNVLLDDALNPKISDFGMARPFGGDLNQAKTKRIVGTYGYMAPEYALYGLFSVKSDVFSFGILLLEIVSGKKNTTRLDNPHKHSNLIGYVWQMWREGRALEVIGPLLDDALVKHEVMRCIHVGLLCIQQNPDDRPNMSTVVLMLNGESTLPQPKEPAFLIDVIPSACSSSSTNASASHSVNDITITMMEGR
ncbi:uncharacterized protein LOC121808766 [Salvia splendens]|uniref:uncharacterized protein LOC121808766 n=1 Tax=Salvia splendens TaxID=180675 RepID=UPI001C27882A|nr:uncharacterized protein LOC121808766 [Salvia splendens]